MELKRFDLYIKSLSTLDRSIPNVFMRLKTEQIITLDCMMSESSRSAAFLKNDRT